MEPQTKKDHYRQYLKMYGSIMMDLADSDDYITYLIAGYRLDDFEKSLRAKIEKMI